MLSYVQLSCRTCEECIEVSYNLVLDVESLRCRRECLREGPKTRIKFWGSQRTNPKIKPSPLKYFRCANVQQVCLHACAEGNACMELQITLFTCTF